MAACTGIIASVPLLAGSDGMTISSVTIDASTDAVEFIFQAEEDATITHVGIGQGTYSLGTAGRVYRVSIQSVDTSLNPSGTILGATSSGYNDYTGAAANNNTFQKLALVESVPLTKGTFYAVVIKYQSGATPSGTEACAFRYALNSTSSVPSVLMNPIPINNNAGSRTRFAYVATFAYYSSTKTYGCPVSAVSSVSYASNTSGADEYGVRFSLPTAWGSTYKLRGFAACIELPGATTADVTLWSNASPPVSIATASIDTDVRRIAGEATWMRFLFTTATAPTLNFGDTYNITIFNNSTSNCRWYNFDVPAAADFGALPWGEITMHEIKRLDAASSFTETTTRRPLAALILEDWTKPAGSGGLVVPIVSSMGNLLVRAG